MSRRGQLVGVAALVLACAALVRVLAPTDGASRASGPTSATVESPSALEIEPRRRLPLHRLRFSGPGGLVLLGDVQASPFNSSMAEVSIAVDRFDPARVVAAAMSLSGGRIWTFASSNGGASWTQQPIPLSDGTVYHADPMVGFDSRGRVHLVHLPRGHSSTLGVEVNHSDDGGLTWTPSKRISSQHGDDKTALVADDDPESPTRDHVFVAWKLPAGGVFFSRSTDGGATYQPVREISSATISGLDVAVSHDGAVYLVANSGSSGQILLFRSLDGGATFEAERPIASRRRDWYTATPSTCTRMALVHASIGIDRSTGPHRGNLYVTWSDYDVGSPPDCRQTCAVDNPCSADVYMSRSLDRGDTWSSPTVVHDSVLPESDQYHQWTEVDPDTGHLYAAYKDTRYDRRRMRPHVYLSRSTDGGETFEDSVPLSSAAGEASNRFQYGDYQGLAVADGRVYAAWTDFRDSSSGSQIYVGRADFDPSLSPSRSAIDFGNVPVGKARKRRLRVTNRGELPVEIGEVRSDHPAFFPIAAKDRCSARLLEPGASCRLRLRFEPLESGLESAHLTLPPLAGDTTEVRVPLFGEGIP